MPKGLVTWIELWTRENVSHVRVRTKDREIALSLCRMLGTSITKIKEFPPVEEVANTAPDLSNKKGRAKFIKKITKINEYCNQ